MIKILGYIFLSCKKATSLIEKKEITQLSIKQKVQLRMHLSMCDVCEKYEKQSILINSLVNKWVNNVNDTKFQLDEGVKLKIVNEIKKQKK